MKLKVELLPCPFCGGSAAFDLNDDRTSSEFVMCKQCGISTDLSDDRAELVTLWNTRDTAERDALRREVEAERKRIATALFEQVLKFNTDERHDDVDPCLVCDILEATSEIWTELRGKNSTLHNR